MNQLFLWCCIPCFMYFMCSRFTFNLLRLSNVSRSVDWVEWWRLARLGRWVEMYACMYGEYECVTNRVWHLHRRRARIAQQRYTNEDGITCDGYHLWLFLTLTHARMPPCCFCLSQSCASFTWLFYVRWHAPPILFNPKTKREFYWKKRARNEHWENSSSPSLPVFSSLFLCNPINGLNVSALTLAHSKPWTQHVFYPLIFHVCETFFFVYVRIFRRQNGKRDECHSEFITCIELKKHAVHVKKPKRAKPTTSDAK